MNDGRSPRFGEWGWMDSRFLELIDGASSGAVFTVTALAVAFVVGIVHALGPGHGKALVASYLAGSDGRPRDAVALGGIVAAMHTGSVLVVGYALHVTRRMPAGDRLGEVLMLASAVAVAAVGAWMLWRHPAVRSRLRGRRVTSRVGAARGRHHAPPAEPVAHDHHPHALPEGTTPLSGAGIVALATSGGLAPSPSAFLVLTTALAVGRPELGLALVGAFSVGLAATLAVVGLGVLWGRDLLLRGASRGDRWRRVSKALPLVAAAGVFLGGLGMAAAAASALV